MTLLERLERRRADRYRRTSAKFIVKLGATGGKLGMLTKRYTGGLLDEATLKN